MADTLTVLDVFYNEYNRYLQETEPPHRAQQKSNEFQTAVCRYLLSCWGLKRDDPHSKMTGAEVQAAQKLMATLSIVRLLHAREDLQKAFDKLNVSQSSRRTYNARLNQALEWAEKQHWWPSSRMHRIADQCRPPQLISGRRHYKDLPLSARRGQYVSYALPEEEMPLPLQSALKEFDRYLTAPSYPGRVFEPVKSTTAAYYLKEIRLMLGFLCKCKKQPISLEQITLQDILPLITEDDLEELNHKQQKKLWREKQLYFEFWFYEYRDFIRETNCSNSPRTLSGKLTAVQRLGHFIYRNEISRKREYQTIPLFAMLQDLINQATKKITKWQKSRTYVANQERKWPDAVEGETALTTLRRTVVERQRLETRPRRKDGTFRDAHVIARSLQHYLKWALLTERPARRQQDYRTGRINLMCPIERPEDVPADGCYFPKPLPEEREKNYDGTFCDNYFYKTYTYQGKHYSQGVWIAEFAAYKTDEIYGVYSMVLPDRLFDDGTSFYDYLEHYLCGWWMPEGYNNRQVYSWWEPQLKGQRGRWVTRGRAEFNPKDACNFDKRYGCAVCQWGYVFPVPTTGELANGISFAGSFVRTSYQILGKRITPHMLRYMWATWGFQAGLTDQELCSLAYAMGHSVQTLRQMYERCSPDEKLRPIEEAIDKRLFQELEEPPDEVKLL